VLHVVSILVSLMAQAQPPAGANLPPKDQAQLLLKEGSALYKAANFAGALQKFQAAYAIYPSPKLQFNIAQADRELGRPVEAVEAFETFLVQAPDSPPELIAEARQSLSELKPRLAQVRVDVLGGALVSVDDRALGVSPIARIIWVTPGRHRITVKHPSYLPASVDVTVSAGEIRTAAPRLLRAGEAPVAAAPPATAPVAAAPAPTAPPPVVTTTATGGPPDSSISATPAPAAPKGGGLAHKPWYFWAAATATTLFTVGAVVAGLSANSKFSGLENSCGKTIAGCTDGQIDGVKSRATVANVLWVLAGASAVATGVTFFVGSREAGASIALRF
jgi:hypothetical protein